MTVQELIKELKSLPQNSEVIYWDSLDNHDITDVQLDSFNEEEVILSWEPKR